MTLTRRSVLAAGAAGSLMSLFPRLALSEIALGDATLTTVSDGSLVLPGDFIFGPMPRAELLPVLAEFDLSEDRLEPECNLALFRDGTHTVLFDAGSGPDFMPSAGRLAAGLEAAGVTPEDITHVVFTHAHPDHIWGVLDDFGDPMFPEATCLMGRGEWDYWWNPETVNTIGAARAAFAVGARRRLEAIEDRTSLFDDGAEILPGIVAVSTPGHTPGHMSFEVRRGSQAAMVLGDAIGNHHVAFRHPAWPSGSDQDAAQAAATRARLFDRIVADDLAVAGFHLPGGGMGRVAAADGGYRFERGNR